MLIFNVCQLMIQFVERAIGGYPYISCYKLREIGRIYNLQIEKSQMDSELNHIQGKTISASLSVVHHPELGQMVSITPDASVQWGPTQGAIQACYGFFVESESTMYLCDSKEQYLQLLSLTRSDEFMAGDMEIEDKVMLFEDILEQVMNMPLPSMELEFIDQ